MCSIVFKGRKGVSHNVSKATVLSDLSGPKNEFSTTCRQLVITLLKVFQFDAYYIWRSCLCYVMFIYFSWVKMGNKFTFTQVSRIPKDDWFGEKHVFDTRAWAMEW